MPTAAIGGKFVGESGFVEPKVLAHGFCGFRAEGRVEQLDPLADLEPGSLPQGGIEVQMLDHGYRQQYEARTGRAGDWFTTHGDVFAVGESRLEPFPPISPDGSA